MAACLVAACDTSLRHVRELVTDSGIPTVAITAADDGRSTENYSSAEPTSTETDGENVTATAAARGSHLHDESATMTTTTISSTSSTSTSSTSTSTASTSIGDDDDDRPLAKIAANISQVGVGCR